MGIIIECLLLGVLFKGTLSGDHFHYGFVNNERQKPFYIFTTPEIVHPGETVKVGVKMSKRLTDTIVNIKLVTWYEETVIANAERFVALIESDKPFLLHLKIGENTREGIAILVIRILQHPYKEERRAVKIEKEKPRLFVETHKSLYNPGDKIELWVLALDRYEMPYKGKIQSLILKDEDGNLIDYLTNKALKEGFASVSLSTKNAFKEGRYIVEIIINNQETHFFINIGKPSESNKHAVEKEFPSIITNSRVRRTARYLSPSRKTISILMSRKVYEVDSEAPLIVVYTKPVNGLNEFQYEVICNGQIHIHQRKYDFYSEFYCGFGIFLRKGSFPSSPTRDELCKNGKTGFSLTFKIRKEMFPSCRFLIYQVQQNGEIVANMKKFDISKKPIPALTINLNKYNAEVNEKLSLEISNTDPGKLLLIGHERTSSRLESDGIISQINLGINKASEMIPNTKSLGLRCKRNFYIAAGQHFKACGITPISNLNFDYEILCNGRTLRGKEIFKADQRILTNGRSSQPWVWNDVDIKDYRHITLKSPQQAGVYYLDAMFISATKGISFAKTLPIKIVQKVSLEKDSNEKKNKTGILTNRATNMHPISVKIECNMDKTLFVYQHCQPLRMKICIRRVSDANRGYITIIIKTVHNFQFNAQDLKRIFRKGYVQFYINMKDKAIFYASWPKLETSCFHVKLKQLGPYEEKLNNGTITYAYKNKNDWKTLQYWITEKDCSII